MNRTSLEASRDLIFEYKENRTDEILYKLIAQFDYLVVYTINKLKKRLWYIKDEDNRDLYQIGILGLLISLDKIAEFKTESIKIPASIMSYIKLEVIKTYGYKIKELTMTNPEVFEELVEKIHFVKYKCNTRRSVDCNIILEDFGLTPDEITLLKRRFLDGLQYKEIATLEGVSTFVINNKLYNLKKKIKRRCNISKMGWKRNE